jgi:rfaE bifunctional protein kinase chain/domain
LQNFIMTPKQLQQRVENISGKRIAVLGDYMLDRYLWGSVSRISPEAPVPIVEIERETDHLGGAANVANNLAALGAIPFCVGVIGEDDNGARLVQMVRDRGFDAEGLILDASRPTTTKTRVIAHEQHLLRMDHESRANIAPHVQKAVRDYLRKLMPSLHALIIEDYNKGVLVQPLLEEVLALARAHRCPVTVDPKFDHFLDYRGVAVFKPNRKEAESVLGFRVGTHEEVARAGQALLEKLQAENVLITLGAEGMALFRRNAEAYHVPTRARSVHDVSGAGDTVIATLTAALAAGADILEAATLANIAAGLVVAEVGAVPVDKQKLLEELAEFKA